jgi:hypothetical protein
VTRTGTACPRSQRSATGTRGDVPRRDSSHGPGAERRVAEAPGPVLRVAAQAVERGHPSAAPSACRALAARLPLAEVLHHHQILASVYHPRVED